MDNGSQNKTISKDNSGFPGYLDFNNLRTEGINYLGQLTGKIWTDYNVHDPGITILEILCYALMDLGYRTNLPIEDILATNPQGPNANNFFSPAQILACNPLTITDYRKLLVDIDGVKNAWLTVATDEIDFCASEQKTPCTCPEYYAQPKTGDDNCEKYLNGLYHVTIELENGADRATVIEKVKAALMTHRNLCEDFVDIMVLCSMDVGVCADIELDSNVNADQLYIEIVQALIDFFSPSPHFYTLQELLDKNIPINDIFAGRPFNITESHGFVDTSEFESIQLRKEIHLSDVYKVIFGIAGVKTINGLELRACDGVGFTQDKKGWKYGIPENYVLNFSTSCSRLNFKRNGTIITVNTAKYDSLFGIGSTNSYKMPSPYLDLVRPNGTYHEGLDDYYSIQNDFPFVYGIAKGGLPDTVTPQRKAQALQLKGYLLFFDQLLADYLAQLKNINTLFAFSTTDATQQHSYFLNFLYNANDQEQPNYVPDVNKLWKLATNGTPDAILGNDGDILAFPAAITRKQLNDLQNTGGLATLSPDTIRSQYPFYCSSPDDLDAVLNLLRFDFDNNNVNVEYVTANDGSIYYCISTSSDDFVLISNKTFPAGNTSDAQNHAGYVLSGGTLDESYTTYVVAGDAFTFNIVLSTSALQDELQGILENATGYEERRNFFLNHLLARFAEQFTDYALLSFNACTNTDRNEISAKEKFISNYDDLSSNRGKAYDYLADKYDNKNVSGFEKRIKALGGFEGGIGNILCNFVVEKYEDQYTYKVNIENETLFYSGEKFDSDTDATNAARQFSQILSDRGKYRVQELGYQLYSIEVTLNEHEAVVFGKQYPSAKIANAVCDRLSAIAGLKADTRKDVFVSATSHNLHLTDYAGNKVRSFADFYLSKDDAIKNLPVALNSINDAQKWLPQPDYMDIGELYFDQNQTANFIVIDLSGYKIDISNTIIDKPDKYTYSLLSKTNSFKFIPLAEFDDNVSARNHCLNVLLLADNSANYKIDKKAGSRKFYIFIGSEKGNEVISEAAFDSKKDAQQSLDEYIGYFTRYTYHALIEDKPYKWKFRYVIGYDPSQLCIFTSDAAYDSQDIAFDELKNFLQNIPQLQFVKNGESVSLSVPGNQAVSQVSLSERNAGKPDLSEQLWKQQAGIIGLTNERSQGQYIGIQKDALSNQGQYVYRLVDKGNIPAFCTTGYSDKKTAKSEVKIIDKLLNSLSYLKICLGGDIVDSKTDPVSQIVQYYYQLKCRNYRYAATGKELILFESVATYQSSADAESAFNANYLMILDSASNENNYSVENNQLFVNTEDSAGNKKKIAIVPTDTVSEFGPDLNAVKSKLAAISNSYPIRIVAYGSQTFNDLFCKKISLVTQNDCDGNQVQYRYYFRLLLGNSVKPKHTWQSIKYYESLSDVREDFDYFLILLKYPGNLYVDCRDCDCKNPLYYIFIREILAESVERFAEDKVWGKEGLEKFICAVQSCHSFHNFLNKETCCYSFYINCGQPVVMHPCKYPSPRKRDGVIFLLEKGITDALNKDSYGLKALSSATFLIKDAEGNIVAQYIGAAQPACDTQLYIIDQIYSSDNYVDNSGVFYLNDVNGNKILQSVTNNKSLNEWKQLIYEYACHFPIVKVANPNEYNTNSCCGQDNTNAQNGQAGMYAIEIKLPGFNSCIQDEKDENLCNCDDNITPDPECYVAWRSTCLYDSCAAAMTDLALVLHILVQYESYRPTFDCDCHSFSIELAYSNSSIADERNIKTSTLNSGTLIAINPQCYPSHEMVCAAEERARRLVNAEGLHVIEHILLRPRCEGDCSGGAGELGCRDVLTCSCANECGYVWKAENSDPCAEEADVCFVPGDDPYSFITTVALPAWPKMFRNKENRLVIENMIYREMPAHIMVRILWLAPRDLCRFEDYYKKWRWWLSGCKNCLGSFNICDFIQFLFNKKFECFDDCDSCMPCPTSPVKTENPCLVNLLPPADSSIFTKQIDDLYCWLYTDCNTKTEAEKDTAPIQATAKNTELEQPEINTAEQKRKAINKRFVKYKIAVSEITREAKNTLVIQKSLAFLQDHAPSGDRFSKLIKEVLGGYSAKKVNKSQAQILVENLVCYYLDRFYFNEQNSGVPPSLIDVLNDIVSGKLDKNAIYNYWNNAEVKAIVPGMDTEIIGKVFAG